MPRSGWSGPSPSAMTAQSSGGNSTFLPATTTGTSAAASAASIAYSIIGRPASGRLAFAAPIRLPAPPARMITRDAGAESPSTRAVSQRWDA